MNCRCNCPDPARCMAMRHTASLDLIQCLDAECPCTCHYTANGGCIPPARWQQQKALAAGGNVEQAKTRKKKVKV